MSNEPETELTSWLSHYHVKDADAALFNKIARAAAVTPQHNGWRFEFNLFPLSLEAVAFCSIALFGFLVGNVVPATYQETVSQQVTYSDSADLNKIIYGPSAWKEVKL